MHGRAGGRVSLAPFGQSASRVLCSQQCARRGTSVRTRKASRASVESRSSEAPFNAPTAALNKLGEKLSLSIKISLSYALITLDCNDAFLFSHFVKINNIKQSVFLILKFEYTTIRK